MLRVYLAEKKSHEGAFIDCDPADKENVRNLEAWIDDR